MREGREKKFLGHYWLRNGPKAEFKTVKPDRFGEKFGRCTEEKGKEAACSSINYTFLNKSQSFGVRSN